MLFRTSSTSPASSWYEKALGFSQVDRKSTRLNSSHQIISYAVFCLKKKKKYSQMQTRYATRTSTEPPMPAGVTAFAETSTAISGDASAWANSSTIADSYKRLTERDK